jgi:hypothetical protein
MHSFPKYSSAGGEEGIPLKRSLVSSPKAELCKFFNASEVRAPIDPIGDSIPNVVGTDDAIGPCLA